MTKKIIGILFGGCSSEYEVSLQSAAAVIWAADPARFTLIPVGITRQGQWYRFYGTPEEMEQDRWVTDKAVPAILSPDRSCGGLLEFAEEGVRKVALDAVLPMLHGKNGEDGTVQGLLALAGIPCIGCVLLSSALCMDKSTAHLLASQAGVKVPRSVLLDQMGSVSDLAKRTEDVAFTRRQIGDFFELTRQLSARGIPLPALHVQSSYGILRYPGLPCRFARPGILLYGCLSDPETMGEIPAPIHPVLSWHSRIALTRQIPEGDTVGYGRRWQARGPRRLAVIPVGYGDGYPRSLSNCHEVLICGQRAPIAGRICMDQMMADITHIPQAHCGSLVTLIGEQEEGRITAEETAARAGTIANELLCRLGDRIRRVTCP